MVESTTSTLEEVRDLAEVLGILNESKRIGQITYSPTRAIVWQAVEPSYVDDATRVALRKERDKLSRQYMRDLKGLFAKAAEKGAAAVEGDIRLLIQSTFERSRELGFAAMGRAGTELDKFDKSIIAAAAEEEFKYAHGFLQDYLNGKGTLSYDRRFAMYGNTVRHQFNMAAYQSVPADTRIYWEIMSFEPCPDCLTLAAGSPYTNDFGNHPLPTVPQAGETRCTGNCKCVLRYEMDKFFVGTEPDMSYEISEFNGEPVTPEWFSTREGRAVQQRMNDLFRTMAYNRQMMDAYPYRSAEWKVYRAARDKALDAILAYKELYNIRATPRANVRDFLAPVDSLKENKYAVIRGPSNYIGEAAILRGLRIVMGTASRVSENSVRMRLVTGRERVYSQGDRAAASLWVPEREL